MTGHMQQVVNAPPTAGEGRRVQRMISALVSAGIEGGYLISQRLARVHWQAGDRALPALPASAAGESALFVRGCPNSFLCPCWGRRQPASRLLWPLALARLAV
jgi:hypothetical protein